MRATIKTTRDTIEVNVPLVKYKRGDIHICYCPVLDLMTYSKKESNLEKYFDETLDHFFEFQIERNSLKETLEKLGWNMQSRKMKSPENMSIPMSIHNATISNRSVRIPCFS
jgi:hypothetical protein